MEKKEKSSSNCKCSEYQEEIQRLQDEISLLNSKCTKLHILIEDNGLVEEVGTISDAEVICTEQIAKLKLLSKESVFSQDDAKTLDILHRNLKMARGEKIKQDGKYRTKKLSDSDLLKLIKE